MVPKRLQVQETIRRYQQIDGIISQTISKKPQFKELLTEKLDKSFSTSCFRIFGFGIILLTIFQSVFSLQNIL